MKDTKHKQKVYEDNTSVPQYYFSSGVIKKIRAKNREFWSLAKIRAKNRIFWSLIGE